MGVTTGLMHSSDPIDSNLPGYLGETALNVEFAHELLAVVEVFEITFQFILEKLLVGGQGHTADVPQQVPEIHGASERNPVGPWIEEQAARDKILSEELVWYALRFVPWEVEARLLEHVHGGDPAFLLLLVELKVKLPGVDFLVWQLALGVG